MKNKFLFLLLLLSFFVLQCAKQTSPTGGPKDETPPKLVSSNPKQEQTRFNKEKIELIFDEHIQLNNPREQILITPSIGKKFEVTARKNKATLEFNAPLQENTTYNINFRECIQDLNEKNPAPTKIAFSTGDFIDSLSISGSVKDALTDTEQKNYTVALAEASDTFNIFKHQASWITLSDAKGKFSIENLKPGNYTIYAFDDKNKNMVVDSKSERYGFLPNTIQLKSQIDTIQLQTFKLDLSALKLISAKPIFNYFLAKVTKGIASYSITSPTTGEKIYSKLDADNSSIKIYNTLTEQIDSLQIRLAIKDSVNNSLDSLIYLKFNKKKSTPELIQSKIEVIKYLTSKSTLIASLTFSKPVGTVYYDSISLQLDSLTRINFNQSDCEWNESLTRLSIKKKYDVNTPAIPTRTIKQPVNPNQRPTESTQPQTTKSPTSYNQLTFSKGTFISVENDTAQSMAQSVKNVTLEETAILLTKITTSENFITQIVDKKFTVIEENLNSKQYNFENLNPGTYQLRLQVDLNKNGKWDPGNYYLKTLPEPVLYYKSLKTDKDINLKANWELGPLLINYP